MNLEDFKNRTIIPEMPPEEEPTEEPMEAEHPNTPVLENMMMNEDEKFSENNQILEHILMKLDDNTVGEYQLVKQAEVVDELRKLQEVIKEKKDVEKMELLGAELVTIKGKPGEPGKPGKTPTQEELLTIIKPLIPEAIPGKDGNDYVLTSEDKKEIAKSIKVPIVEKIIEKTEVIKELPIYNTTNVIKEVIREISKEEIDKIATEINPIIEYSKIKNAPQWPAGGLSRITKPEVQAMIDAIPPAANAFVDLTDTFVSYTGLGGKGLRVNATEDGIDTYIPTDTDEKVKYDASDPTAGYVADKFVAGTGITLAEGTGADENKLLITNTLDLSNYMEIGDNVSLLTNDAGYLTAESDTLQSVTDRGTTTTNNITVSNSNPKLIASSTATDSPKTWLEKLTTLDGSQLVSQGRRFAPANAISILGTTGTMANQPSLSGAFFYSLWIWSDGAAFQSLLSNGTNNINLRGAAVSPPYTRVSGFGGSTVDFFAVSGQPSLAGRWTHIVIGRNGSGQWSMWYDGVASPQNGSSCGTTTLSSFTVPITTNADADEIIIYNIAPTQSLVDGLYNSGVPTRITDYTNVLAHWSADQSSGTTLTDNSGNGRNVTGITGATWITGVVQSNILQALTDIPVLKMVNNGIAGSYGTFTHGWYETTRGTTNIYEGLSHQFNVLGSSKATITSSGFNIAEYTGAFITTTNGSSLSLAFSGTTTTRKVTLLSASDGGYISGKGSTSDNLFLGVGEGASKIVTINSTGVTTSVPVLTSAGAVGTPAHSFSADPNTGMYNVSPDVLGFATAGVSRMQIGATGEVSIGTTPNTAIMFRVINSNTQLAATKTGIYLDGVHTLNANSSVQWRGNYAGPAINQAGFNQTTTTANGGAVPSFYAFPQATGSSGTVTNVTGFFSTPRNTGAGTVTDLIGYTAAAGINSGGGVITNNYGFCSLAQTVGTNNYDFYGETAAASGRWGFYQAGGADNYFAGNVGFGVAPSEALEVKDAGNIKFQTTTGTKIGTATTQKIGFWNATPVIQQVTNAYTSDGEGSAYTGIDNLQVGTPYAQVSDLNQLRVAYETLRSSYDDLLTKLKTTGVVA